MPTTAENRATLVAALRNMTPERRATWDFDERDRCALCEARKFELIPASGPFLLG